MIPLELRENDGLESFATLVATDRTLSERNLDRRPSIEPLLSAFRVKIFILLSSYALGQQFARWNGMRLAFLTLSVFGQLRVKQLADLHGHICLGRDRPQTLSPAIYTIFSSDEIGLRSNSSYTVAYLKKTSSFLVIWHPQLYLEFFLLEKTARDTMRPRRYISQHYNYSQYSFNLSLKKQPKYRDS
jgi:hypothetical protein